MRQDCARIRADASNKKKKNVQENLNPKFVTYREQIDGEYWFPTYTSADDILHFRTNDVHIREIIKHTNYKRFGSKIRIIYKGEAKDDSAPPPERPIQRSRKRTTGRECPLLSVICQRAVWSKVRL